MHDESALTIASFGAMIGGKVAWKVETDLP